MVFEGTAVLSCHLFRGRGRQLFWAQRAQRAQKKNCQLISYLLKYIMEGDKKLSAILISISFSSIADSP